MVYDFNLLVSHEWRNWYAARQEILLLLRDFGDAHPIAREMAARGLTGVKTALRSRDVIRSLGERFSLDPSSLRFTLKF